MTVRPFAPGDIVVCGGVTAFVWSCSAKGLTVLPARKASGARRRDDIGTVPLCPIRGSMTVSVSRSETWQPTTADRIGTVQPDVIRAVKLAVSRETEARQTEASVASSIFAACKPSFRSGGRRVGGGARE